MQDELQNWQRGKPEQDANNTSKTIGLQTLKVTHYIVSKQRAAWFIITDNLITLENFDSNIEMVKYFKEKRTGIPEKISHRMLLQYSQSQLLALTKQLLNGFEGIN